MRRALGWSGWRQADRRPVPTLPGSSVGGGGMGGLLLRVVAHHSSSGWLAGNDGKDETW